MSDSIFDTVSSSVGLGTAATFSQSLWENIYEEEDENYAADVETSDVCCFPNKIIITENRLY